MAFLESESDAEHYQGWSLTRIYIEEVTQFATQAPVMRLLATLQELARHPLPDAADLQPRRPRPPLGQELGDRQRRLQCRHRRRDETQPRLHPGQDLRQPGAAGVRPALHRSPEGGRQAAAGARLAGGRLGPDRGRLLRRVVEREARHPAVPDPRRLDPLPLDGLGLRPPVLRRLVDGGAGRPPHRRRQDPAARRPGPLPRMVWLDRHPQCRPQAAGREGRRRHRFP